MARTLNIPAAMRSFQEIPGPVSYPFVGNLYQYVFGPFQKTKYQDALKSLHQGNGHGTFN